jgi:hypothetical protein
MSVTTAATPPRWFWVIAILVLLWMLMGVAAWTMDFLMDEAGIAALTDAQRTLYERRPQWVAGVYGVAVFSGLLGAILLLLRKSIAPSVLLVSLIAVCIQMGYTFGPMDAIGVLGAATAVPFPVTIIALGIAAVYVARLAQRNGWLGR